MYQLTILIALVHYLYFHTQSIFQNYLKIMTYGALGNISHQGICMSSTPWQGKIKKNKPTKFDYYISSYALTLPPTQEPVLNIPPWPPRLQCSKVLGAFQSSYWLQFQILGNGSNSTFILYKANMPPQEAREQVDLLSPPQINFLFWLNFFLVFCILFENVHVLCLYHLSHAKHYQCPLFIHKVHWCILHCPTLVYGDNIDSRYAYYTILHHKLELCILKILLLKKIVQQCYIDTRIPQGAIDTKAHCIMQTCIF